MILALLATVALQTGDDSIGGVPYERRATREATLEHMLDRLVPEDALWGEWFLLAPFPFDEVTGMDAVHPPERELDRMSYGGPGPDLAAGYTGKNGVEVRWTSLGHPTNQRVTLNNYEDAELNDWSTAYLYTTLTSERAQRIEVPFGSDDGVRVWLNGEIVFEADWMRGMTAGEDLFVLDLEAGVNHALLEVFQGVGGWEFQVQTRGELSAVADAELFYRLDRDFPPSRERSHYNVMSYPVPDDVVLEVGGLDFLSDGRPVVSTRRGDVYVVENAYDQPPLDAEFRLFATGLHEALGVGVRHDPEGEAIYTVQRGELTRLLDTDTDGRADWYQTVSDGWGVSGNYHEFAFGPEFDSDGNAWVTLNVGFCGSLGKALVPWRGWALKITPAGDVVPVCDGLRSPNGIGSNAAGDMFYVENQGDYVATNRLSHLAPDSWHGHPASLRWRTGLEPNERPPRQPPAVWFPYGKMGQSAADIALDEGEGAFGPFDGQLFVGDQTRASVMRVFLEQVDGHYQGACFPFLSDLASGVNRVAFAPDGSMLVGQTDRGWGSVGRRRHGLERIVFTGVTPFEIQAMRAVEGGFELEFTRPVDPASAGSADSYSLESYTYDYHADYGAPERDRLDVNVQRVTLGAEGRRATLHCSPLRAGYVHELRSHGVRDAAGEPLLHEDAYYTLVNVPGRVADAGDTRALPGAQALPALLFVTHSAGHVHDVVERSSPDSLALAEQRLIEATAGRYRVTATQDTSVLTTENLAHYDAVLFYTTGELPRAAGQALVDWVRAGGAFAGVHSATDTFHEFPAYRAMIGGVFAGHPWNEQVEVVVVDRRHPATAMLGAGFSIADEIYQFSDFAPEPVHVLARLGSAASDPTLAKGQRAQSGYPLAWCRDYGQGRVFYTALGHREEVWRDERFLAHLVGGVDWTVAAEPTPARVPRGAQVVFDHLGGLSTWHHTAGGTPQWSVGDGSFTVAAGTGDLVTRAEWGDHRLHVEFRTPLEGPDVSAEQRGNSGVYLHGRYEVQVLDSFGLESGAGDCAAIYGVRAPTVNACRPSGEWQSFDVSFRAPRFAGGGVKSENARLTLWHNGVLVHDDVELPAPTAGGLGGAETPTGPLLLQDHGSAVQYRNIWIQPR